MCRQIIGWLLFCCLFPIHSYCQKDAEPKTPLQLLWEKADKNNKQLQLRHIAKDKAVLRTEIYKESRWPELTASGEYARISNMPIYDDGLFHAPSYMQVIHKMYGLNLDASFDVYNGDLFKNNLKEKQLEEKIATENIALDQNSLHYGIAVHYLDIYRNKQYKSYITQDISERERQLRDIQNLFDKGVVLKSDVLRAELKLSQQKEFLQETENNIIIASQHINQLTGDSIGTAIDTDFGVDDVNQQLQHSAENPAAQTFEYHILSHQSAIEKTELDKVQKSILPKVQLYGSYGYNYPQVRFYPYSDAPYLLGMVGLRASMSLTEIFRNKKKTAEAKIAIRENEIQKQDFQDRFTVEINRLKIRHQEALDKMEVAKSNIQTAQETYRIMKNTYFAQLSLLTDLLEAETHLLEAKMDYTTEEVNALLLNFQLLKTTGNL